MEHDDLRDVATAEHLARATRAKLSPGAPAGHHAAHDGATSVREATYKGRRIRIETTYSITVDDQPLGGHVMVGNTGRVHYHSIPNQEFGSAVDMVKRLIDLMPSGEAGGAGYSEKGG